MHQGTILWCSALLDCPKRRNREPSPVPVLREIKNDE